MTDTEVKQPIITLDFSDSIVISRSGFKTMDGVELGGCVQIKTSEAAEGTVVHVEGGYFYGGQTSFEADVIKRFKRRLPWWKRVLL